jgi:hypothetical protein
MSEIHRDKKTEDVGLWLVRAQGSVPAWSISALVSAIENPIIPVLARQDISVLVVDRCVYSIENVVAVLIVVVWSPLWPHLCGFLRSTWWTIAGVRWCASAGPEHAALIQSGTASPFDQTVCAVAGGTSRAAISRMSVTDGARRAFAPHSGSIVDDLRRSQVPLAIHLVTSGPEIYSRRIPPIVRIAAPLAAFAAVSYSKIER